MSKNKETDLGLSSLTEAELDDFALNHGGRVARLEDSGFIRGPLKNSFGYTFRWLESNGSRYQGTIVMASNDAIKNKLLINGKIKVLMNDNVVSEDRAYKIVIAGKKVSRGQEDRVIRCLIDTWDFTIWDTIPKYPNEIMRWSKLNKIPGNLTHTRIIAVANMRKMLNLK